MMEPSELGRTTSPNMTMVEVDAYNNRKFKGIVTQIASSAKVQASMGTSNDVTNYEVKIRLERKSYEDLIDPARPKRFPFRPGMTASADIKTITCNPFTFFDL